MNKTASGWILIVIGLIVLIWGSFGFKTRKTVVRRRAAPCLQRHYPSRALCAHHWRSDYHRWDCFTCVQPPSISNLLAMTAVDTGHVARSSDLFKNCLNARTRKALNPPFTRAA